MTPGSVMIFAAGFGSRMGLLTQDRPKPLISVAGRSLLDRALDMARNAQMSRLVVNTHYKAAMIQRHLQATGQADVLLSYEDPILETGGGLRHAMPLLGQGPVVTLNSDTVWRGANPLTQLCKAWGAHQPGALLLCVPRDRAIGHKGPGDFSLRAGHLHRGGDLVYTGAQIIDPDILTIIPETSFSLNRVWDVLAGQGRLAGLVYKGAWCDVGHPGGIPLAEALLTDVSPL